MEPLRNVVMVEDDFSESDVVVGGVDVERAQLIDGDGERNRTVYNGIVESEGVLEGKRARILLRLTRQKKKAVGGPCVCILVMMLHHHKEGSK